jgi:HEAT repeat protein
MQHHPTTRRWLLGTLWGVMALTLAVTGVALWPMIYRWWVIRSLIQELTAARLKENPRAVDAAQGKLGEIGRPAVPALLKLMRHPDAEARRKAIFALYTIDGRIEEAVPPVIDALRQDEDEHVRYASCWMLGKHGSAANGAVAALKDALNDDSELIQMYAAGCLGRLGS